MDNAEKGDANCFGVPFSHEMDSKEVAAMVGSCNIPLIQQVCPSFVTY